MANYTGNGLEVGVDIESAIVTAVPDEQSGPVHTVQTRPTTSREPISAMLLPFAHNSGAVPTEGDRVLVLNVGEGSPVVLSALPDEGEPESTATLAEGERQLSHAASDARVRFTPGGDVVLSAENGPTLRLNADGTISIGEGNTPIVTDVSASTTTDGDGHVTDVTLDVTTDSSIQV